MLSIFLTKNAESRSISQQMLEDKGNTAVYLLYAYTRIKSIGRSAQLDDEAVMHSCRTKPISLDHEKEWKLAKVSAAGFGFLQKWRIFGFRDNIANFSILQLSRILIPATFADLLQ